MTLFHSKVSGTGQKPAPFRVDFLKSPVTCSSYITLAIVIHSHPEHIELRSTLRQTWAQETQNTRRIFIVGITDNTLARDAIIEESEEFGDVVQGDFIDSYRNMTYKHLLGYRWINEHCPDASYVLKSDDDQFVDTLQLGRYLSAFLPPTVTAESTSSLTCGRQTGGRTTRWRWNGRSRRGKQNVAEA